MAVGIFGYALFLYEDGNGSSALIWGATAVLFLSYAYSTMARTPRTASARCARPPRNADRLRDPAPWPFLEAPCSRARRVRFPAMPCATFRKRWLSGAICAPTTAAARFTPELWKYARHNWIEYSLTVARWERGPNWPFSG